MDWEGKIRKIAPHGKPAIVKGLAATMPQICAFGGLNTPLRQAHFLAQVCHETDGLATLEEYASGAAYEGRHDLGNIYAGDGPRYKGRGPFQLTGRANYRDIGRELGLDLEAEPKRAGAFPVAGLTAAMFWRGHRLNAHADRDDVLAVSIGVNGKNRKTGLPNGLASRKAFLKAAKRVLLTDDAPPAAAEKVTAHDLRKAGSRTIAGADAVKGGVGGLVASGTAAGGVLSQISDTASQVQDTIGSAQSSVDAFAWVGDHWRVIALAALAAVALYFLARIWFGARQITLARVEDALSELVNGASSEPPADSNEDA
jgi:putative chitinase